MTLLKNELTEQLRQFCLVFVVVASSPLESVILEGAREAGVASRGHREAEWESPAFSSHGQGGIALHRTIATSCPSGNSDYCSSQPPSQISPLEQRPSVSRVFTRAQ